MSSSPKQFLIFSLPRSRSAWLAWYLSYPPAEVGHDLLVGCKSVSEFETRFSTLRGSVETGAMLGWRLIRRRLPDVKLLVVFRSVEQVMASFAKLGIQIDRAELEFRFDLLIQLAAEPGVEAVHFDQLDDPICGKWLFEYCLEEEWDWSWFSRASRTNIQIDFPNRLAQLYANQTALAGLKSEVEVESRKLMI